MGKLAICGDCAKAFEPDESCPFCALDSLKTELQIAKNLLATAEEENKRLREESWRQRLSDHQKTKSGDSGSAT